MFRQTILFSTLLRGGILILATMIMLIEVVVAEKINDKVQGDWFDDFFSDNFNKIRKIVG